MKSDIYYVLTLSHKKVELYQGDAYGLIHLDIKGLPHSMKDSLQIDEYPQSRQTHTIAPSGKGSEAFHRQYNVRQTDKAMLLEFFRLVNKRLQSFFHDKSDPLILAAAGYLQPIYRQVNTYPNLLIKGLPGNADHLPLHELHERVESIVLKSHSRPKYRQLV